MARGTNRPAQQQLSFGEARRPQPPVGPRLLVLPDAARVEEHLLRTAAEPGVARGDAVCTIAELERALIWAAPGGPAIASAQALELVYRRVAREETERSSPWFEVRETPGFARALRQLAAALGQGMVPPAALRALVPQLDERAQRRLGPLAQLLEAAQARLAASGRCDGATALAAALEGLRGEGPLPRRLRGISAVRIEAVLDWPPLRLELLFALAERLGRARIGVQLVLPFWAARRELAEEPLAPVLRAIEERGAKAGAAAPELVLQPLGDDGPLGPFRARLFSRLRAEDAPARGEEDGEVALASCASPAAEAREAARRCADLLDAGAAPDAIAIAVRSLAGGAAEELICALEQLGLPWRERRGRPALSAPPVQLALSLYELLERDVPREGLAALLGSGLLWMRASGERAPPEAIARRLRQARVRDDRADGGVAARLEALEARLRRAASAAEGHAQSSLEREAAEVAEVRARCERALAGLRSLPRQATLRAHAAALAALLERWELRSRAQRGLEGPGADQLPNTTIRGPLARAERAAQERALAGLDALEACCAALAAAASEVGEERSIVSRAAWAELLAGALGEASLRPPGARGAAIQLLELRELPGRAVEHLIVAGLVEGQLPAQGAIDPLLSEEEKRALNRAARRAIFRASSRAAPTAGTDGPALPARQAEEPLLFQLALGAARRSLLLLWPRADAKGREAPRSTFADEAARALGLSPSDGAPLARPAPGRIARIGLAAISELASCRSADELLARASLDAIADPAFRALAPAPPDEARALLAALARSPLRAPLLQVARAALAERERLGAFIGSRPPGRFSGQLREAALEAALPLFAFGPEAPISGSQLEDDARCPFRTFGHRVLHLREEEPQDDELSPRDRGTLLHRCLEVFYAAQAARGALPLAGPRQAWAGELRALALAEMERFAREREVGHPGLWRLRRDELLLLLEEVVEAESERSANPVALEQAFGGREEQSWPPLRIPAPSGDAAVFARGAIDRVDAGASSSRLIVDYKSGALTSHARKLRADALFAPEFQLPLYVAAVRAREPGRAVDALYLSLRDADRSQTLGTTLAKGRLSLEVVSELDPARRAEARARGEPNLGDAVWTRVERLRAGGFAVQPTDCELCDLKPVCRIAALPVDEESLR